MVIELTEYTENSEASICALDLLNKKIDLKEKKPTKIVNIEIICKGVKEDIKNDSVIKFLDLINNHFYCSNINYKFDFKIKDCKQYKIQISADMSLDNYILKNFKIEPKFLYKFNIKLQWRGLSL